MFAIISFRLNLGKLISQIDFDEKKQTNKQTEGWLFQNVFESHISQKVILNCWIIAHQLVKWGCVSHFAPMVFFVSILQDWQLFDCSFEM